MFRFLLFLTLFDFSISCDGYSIKLISIDPCSDVKSNQVFKFNPGANIKLTPDCRLLMYGCIEWEAFNMANTTFNMIRNGRTVQKKNFDFCKKTQSSNLHAILSGFGLPELCPTPAGKRCVNGTRPINITNKKMMLAMLHGTPTLRFYVLHDRNRRTCYEIKLLVTNDADQKQIFIRE